MTSNRIKFTKPVLNNLPPAPAGKRVTYHDTVTPGLELRVTETGTKTFVLRRRVRGKEAERVKLGYFPDITPDQARALADEHRPTMVAGRSVNAERRAEKARAVTLSDAFTAYITARSGLKANTRGIYDRVMNRHLKDWQRKPLTALTWGMVRRRHKELSKVSPTAANQAMRVLRAVLNYAMGEYRDEDGKPILIENPVGAISHDRAWNREERRKGHIEPYQLREWWQATDTLDEVFRDYLRLTLLTGLRRREAGGLRWADVDLPGRKLIVPETKNSTEHTLPLTDYLFDMLTRRQHQAANEWVFPSLTSKSGHIEEPKAATARVAAEGGVRVTVHDLRRTFVTIAESLDIPPYTLKRLLNHKSGNTDVTRGYIVIDIERLREPMQRITDFILKSAEIIPSADVVALQSNTVKSAKQNHGTAI